MRLRSLDSLRGVAALFVVLHHWVFVFWGDHMPFRHPAGAHQIIVDVLYHFSTFGPAAVQIFFVLSGLVLTLALQRDGDDYGTFVLKRIMRIYPPYLAAVLFSLALVWLVPAGPISQLSPWFNGFWMALPSFGVLAGHIGMVGSPRFESLDSVAWSLIHELRISLVFPLIVLLVRRSVWTIAAAFLVSTVARYCADDVGPLLANVLLTFYFTATFFMGSALALHLGTVRQWYERLPRYRKILLFALVFVLLNVPAQIFGGKLSVVTIGIGGAGLVALCAIEPRIKTSLERRRFLYFGRISYSLYLFHFPVMLATLHFLYPLLPAHAVVIVGSVLIWIVSDLANRLVEKPCQRFSHYMSTRRAWAN